MLYLDLETRSDLDLIFYGLKKYALHASTATWCMAYAFYQDPIKFWWSVDPFPAEVQRWIDNGGLITAHNAEFERHIFEHVLTRTHGITAPDLRQWRCSMIMGLTNGFAGGLDALATGLGLQYHKHRDGPRLIREYCASGHLTEFKPGDADLMEAYNVGDVKIMRAAVQCLRNLTSYEWLEFHINCEMNQRGLPIDVAFCEAALAYSREVADDANAQIERLTGGLMTRATQRKARDAWLFPKLTEYQLTLLEVYKKGEKKHSLDADHRRYLLECEDLDHDARSLLEYIDNAGSSALKKFAVAAHQHQKGSVHNTFLFNGAGSTGRFSGKGLQPHNFRRDVFGDNQAEEHIQEVLAGTPLGQPADTLARLLRAMIQHPDGLYWVDWSSIEGRVAPWLANSADGEAKLDVFRAGRDVYVATAASMLRCSEKSITSADRQIGKIAELSLQFGGSHHALMGMAKNYRLKIDEMEARHIVELWRAANPWATAIWDHYATTLHHRYRQRVAGGLEIDVEKLVSRKDEKEKGKLVDGGVVGVPGSEQDVGRVTYFMDVDKNFLWCRLPSKRLLAYPKPKTEYYMTPWGDERWGATFQSHFKPAAGEPPIRRHARGALLFQNTVQAVAADCLREALVEAYDAGLDIRGHVHDEIIGVGPREDGERLNEIMLEEPWWADGLPIATGGVSYGKRYGK